MHLATVPEIPLTYLATILPRHLLRAQEPERPAIQVRLRQLRPEPERQTRETRAGVPLPPMGPVIRIFPIILLRMEADLLVLIPVLPIILPQTETQGIIPIPAIIHRTEAPRTIPVSLIILRRMTGPEITEAQPILLVRGIQAEIKDPELRPWQS